MTYAIVVKPAGQDQFRYYGGANQFVVQGRSHQPLLRACRELYRMGARPDSEIALYHAGRFTWALRTTIGAGAGWRTFEPPSGATVRFMRFIERPAFWKAAA